MSYEPPHRPSGLPAEVVERLEDLSPERLRDAARYADELAEYREREARLSDDEEIEEVDEKLEDTPEDVPSKATITIKEINDNRYYYWQWREGDQIRSKYRGPVDGEE